MTWRCIDRISLFDRTEDAMWVTGISFQWNLVKQGLGVESGAFFLERSYAEKLKSQFLVAAVIVVGRGGRRGDEAVVQMKPQGLSLTPAWTGCEDG